MVNDSEANEPVAHGRAGEVRRPTKKRRDYMVRLAPHHAELVEARARRAKLPPAAYIRDRVVNLVEGTDPQDFFDATAELRQLLDALVLQARELRRQTEASGEALEKLAREVRAYAHPVKELLARIRLQEVEEDEAEAG